MTATIRMKSIGEVVDSRNVQRSLEKLASLSVEDLSELRSHIMQEWNYFDGRNQALANSMWELYNLLDAVREGRITEIYE